MPNTLVCLTDEDLGTARRKSPRRRRRLWLGRRIERWDAIQHLLTYCWWQPQGRYEWEVEVGPDGHGHYTGRARCAQY